MCVCVYINIIYTWWYFICVCTLISTTLHIWTLWCSFIVGILIFQMEYKKIDELNQNTLSIPQRLPQFFSIKKVIWGYYYAGYFFLHCFWKNTLMASKFHPKYLKIIHKNYKRLESAHFGRDSAKSCTCNISFLFPYTETVMLLSPLCGEDHRGEVTFQKPYNL